MPIYISRGRFTTDAVKGLMAKPENREVVSLPVQKFRAVDYKPAGQPQLILRMRTKTDDYELLADVEASKRQGASRLHDGVPSRATGRL
jgi:hypothetical protein